MAERPSREGCRRAIPRATPAGRAADACYARAMGSPPIVAIHHLEHGLLAAGIARELDRDVRLLSPPDAAVYLGPGWMEAIERAVEAQTGLRMSGILDCADRPDLVQAAFRQGTRAVVFRGRKAVAAKLADIARGWRAELMLRRPRALDLGADPDPEPALRRYLGAD